MAIGNRVVRLFKADFHALLDQIEEPAVLLRQAIREMEEDLKRSQQQLKWLQQEKRDLDGRIEEIRGEVARIDDELTICLESDNEDLARACVKRKLQATQLALRLQSKAQSTEQSLSQLSATIEENQETLDSLQQKAELFSEWEAPAGYGDCDWLGAQLHVTDHDVEVALLKEKKSQR